MPASYVLIHGGTTTGRFWDRLVPFLDGPWVAPSMPGRADRPADLTTLTVSEAAASLVRDVEAVELPGDLVVVAHSSGGLEVPEVVVGLGLDRVTAIVMSAASVPTEGGTGMECMQPRHAEASMAFVEAARAEGTMILAPKPDPDRMRTSSGEELDDEQHAFVVDEVRSCDDSFSLYLSPVRWSTVAQVPVTYVVNLGDRALPPDLQREMLGRLPNPTTVHELDCGHLAAVTRPRELAAIITSAYRLS